MFETVVIATDGSESALRAIRTALDLGDRFDATAHALYVVDTDEIDGTPQEVREEVDEALRTAGEDALSVVEYEADDDIVTARREGTPDEEIIEYAEEVDADAIVMGTRGRHGDHAFLLGSVAEAVVRHAPLPVLTVRQLEDGEQS